MTRLRPASLYRLSAGKRNVCRVWIWPDYDTCYGVVGPEYRRVHRRKPSFTAYFMGPRTKIRITPSGKSRVDKPAVGDIHLVNGYFGGGVFAHELQHFVQWFIDIFGLSPMDRHWETVAEIAGEMTREFWERFYEDYDPYPPEEK